MPGTSNNQTNAPRKGAEKRTYQRYPIKLRGYLRSSALFRCGIDILDFCLGGLYLHLDEKDTTGVSVTMPSPGDIMEVAWEIPGTPKPHAVQFNGRIVRVNERFAGVALVDPSMASLKQMIAYITSQQAGPPPGAAIAGAQAHLTACRNLVVTMIDPLIRTLIRNASASLVKSANDTSNQAEKNEMLSALNFLRKSEAGRTNEFHNEFHAIIQEKLAEQLSNISPSAQKTTSKKPKLTLSLIDEGDLNQWISVSDIAIRSEQMHAGPLQELEKRLTLLSRVSIDRNNNPFGPAVFAQAYIDTLHALNCPTSAQPTLCKYFRDELCNSLEKIYEALNDYLIKQGILSAVDYKVVNPER